MFNSPYAFPNPYQQNFNQGPQVPNPQQVIKVNGRGGAEAYQMAANSSALLLDETAPILWLKQTDGAGYPALTAYDISPHQEQAPIDMKALEARITKLEEALNNGYQSNIAGTGRKDTSGEHARPGKANDTDNKVLK